MADTFDNWLKNHQNLGGFLASSYVDWNILHPPKDDIASKFIVRQISKNVNKTILYVRY